ncbi:MAG: hypothetical protein WDW36_002853 [Sanguina aurantia]
MSAFPQLHISIGNASSGLDAHRSSCGSQMPRWSDVHLLHSTRLVQAELMQSVNAGEYTGWRLLCLDSAGSSRELRTDYLVMSHANLTASPPTHPRIVVIGDSTAATECAKGLAQQQQRQSARSSSNAPEESPNITLLYQQTHWPLSTSMTRLQHSWFKPLLRPPYYHASIWRRFLSAVSTPLRSMFWALTEERLARVYEISPSLRPKVKLVRDMFHGSQQPTEAGDWLGGAASLGVQLVQGEELSLQADGILLKDGSVLRADVVVRTGLGLYDSNIFSTAVQLALGVKTEGAHLYRGMLPPGVPRLAFIQGQAHPRLSIVKSRRCRSGRCAAVARKCRGEARACSTSDRETESLQAEWLCSLLTEQISLPARATMMSDVWAQQTWRRKTMPRHRYQSSLQYPSMYTADYQQQLISDMGSHYSKPLPPARQPEATPTPVGILRTPRLHHLWKPTPLLDHPLGGPAGLQHGHHRQPLLRRERNPKGRARLYDFSPPFQLRRQRELGGRPPPTLAVSHRRLSPNEAARRLRQQCAHLHLSVRRAEQRLAELDWKVGDNGMSWDPRARPHVELGDSNPHASLAPHPQDHQAGIQHASQLAEAVATLTLTRMHSTGTHGSGSSQAPAPIIHSRAFLQTSGHIGSMHRYADPLSGWDPECNAQPLGYSCEIWGDLEDGAGPSNGGSSRDDSNNRLRSISTPRSGALPRLQKTCGVSFTPARPHSPLASSLARVAEISMSPEVMFHPGFRSSPGSNTGGDSENPNQAEGSERGSVRGGRNSEDHFRGRADPPAGGRLNTVSGARRAATSRVSRLQGIESFGRINAASHVRDSALDNGVQFLPTPRYRRASALASSYMESATASSPSAKPPLGTWSRTVTVGPKHRCHPVRCEEEHRVHPAHTLRAETLLPSEPSGRRTSGRPGLVSHLTRGRNPAARAPGSSTDGVSAPMDAPHAKSAAPSAADLPNQGSTWGWLLGWQQSVASSRDGTHEAQDLEERTSSTEGGASASPSMLGSRAKSWRRVATSSHSGRSQTPISSKTLSHRRQSFPAAPGRVSEAGRKAHTSTHTDASHTLTRKRSVGPKRRRAPVLPRCRPRPNGSKEMGTTALAARTRVASESVCPDRNTPVAIATRRRSQGQEPHGEEDTHTSNHTVQHPRSPGSGGGPAPGPPAPWGHASKASSRARSHHSAEHRPSEHATERAKMRATSHSVVNDLLSGMGLTPDMFTESTEGLHDLEQPGGTGPCTSPKDSASPLSPSDRPNPALPNAQARPAAQDRSDKMTGPPGQQRVGIRKEMAKPGTAGYRGLALL